MSSTAPLLIGLIGPAGAGKSTVAGYLAERWAFEELAFADPLVNMLHSLLADAGVGAEWITERSLKEQPTPVLGVSYRRLAQTLGTEWGRSVRDDLWIRIAQEKIERMLSYGLDVVVSDVRFGNEAAALRALGGVLVRVNRPVPELPDNRSRHASEALQASLPQDYLLWNHGSLATLEQQADSLVDQLRDHARRAT